MSEVLGVRAFFGKNKVTSERGLTTELVIYRYV